MKSAGFHCAWALAFWLVGATLILTDVIHSGAPAMQLYVLALGAFIHAFSVAQFGDNMSSFGSIRIFYRSISQSWQRALGWGAIGGFCDVVVMAGLFMAYPLLPDVGGAWAVAIMMGILLLPQYPVLLALIYFGVRTDKRRKE